MIQTHFADVGDATLHYATAGTGPTLVLLHGWPQSWRCWRKVIPLLAPDYTVIAPDLRGLGQSSLAEDGYAKRLVAGDVWTLVHDVLGHREFHSLLDRFPSIQLAVLNALAARVRSLDPDSPN